MRLISRFLLPGDIMLLREIASKASGWTPGRQGTGYHVLNLKDEPRIASLCQRTITILGVNPDELFWDCFLIRYGDGDFIPTHKDEASLFGRRHERLNALVTEPEAKSGILTVNGEPVVWATGDAIVFFPDEEEHSVSEVKDERLVWSVGHWTENASFDRLR